MAAQNGKDQIARLLYDITHVQWKYPFMKFSRIIEEEISEEGNGIWVTDYVDAHDMIFMQSTFCILQQLCISVAS